MVTTANSPVIFLVGNERYLKEKAVNELKVSLLDGSSGELDYKVLYGSDTSADRILDCASTIPFFSSKRLIVVKAFDELSKEDIAKLISYIKKPNKYTCLVIDTEEAGILERDPSLLRHVKVLTFGKLTDMELSKWITKYLVTRSVTIDEDALEILKELQGADLLNLSQELEKLITFVGSRKNITRSDIEELVGNSAILSAFDIADAVAGNDISKAVAIVYGLLDSGKKPYEIIGILSWHFKRILKAKVMISKGGTEYSASQALRVHRKSSNEFFAQVQSFSFEEIGRKMDILLEADLGIKRAKYSPSLILEFAVIKLCLG